MTSGLSPANINKSNKPKKDDLHIQWQCTVCTVLNGQSLDKCSVCESARPLASYSVISEIEHDHEEQVKLEKQVEMAKQTSMTKAKSMSRAKTDASQNWGDDDFKDDDDDEFGDGDGWDDDNNDDWDMDNTDNNKDEDGKEEHKGGGDDDGGWDDDELMTQDQIPISTDITPLKIREFEVLNPYKLHEYMSEILKSMQGILFMDNMEHVAVLCRFYRWNRNKMLDEYMMAQDDISKKVGLYSQKKAKPIDKSDPKFFCFLCCVDVSWNETFDLGCNHVYCHACWTNYLTAEMEKGPRVVNTRCIEPKCKLIVPPDVFDRFLEYKHKMKFQEYLLHSFVEGRKELQWCPGLDCINAAKAEFGSMITIECTCSHLWCFACKEDAHLPCNCEVAAKWTALCTTDKENLTWVNAYAKKCVKCKNFIEKNQGCSHMTCRCGYEFCWLCLKEWKSVGGYGHACNKPKELVEQEKEVDKLKGYLERFTFYSERFGFNAQAVDITSKKSLKNANDIVSNLVKTKNNIKYNDVEFIIDAIHEIIRSRRILQWSYCYGYFCKDKTREKDLFETQQTQLDQFANQLHDKSEKVVDDPEQHVKVLDIQYRQNIIHLTKTVTRYRKNITAALAEQEIVFQPGIWKEWKGLK